MSWLRFHLLRRTAAHIANYICVLIALGLNAAQIDAADIKELKVFENGGVYHINMSTAIDAPAEYVHKVLTDYVHLYHLSSSIVESKVLPSPGNGAVRVKTRISNCILVFCIELDRVEDVFEQSSNQLHTIIIPSLSDFRSGRTEWKIEPQGDHSQVIYEAQLEPDFVVFPIIGPALITKNLRNEMITSLVKAECIAKMKQELDWNIHLQVANIDIHKLCGEKCTTDTGKCTR